MEQTDLRYLKSLAKQYPTVAAAATEIINLQAILSLPKGTEHFITDIHGDLLIAVNRSYGKSDYIPCICWGRNARFASGFEVGGHVQVWGRIQSREYVKKLSETETEKRVAYEVSVSKVEFIEDEE